MSKGSATVRRVADGGDELDYCFPFIDRDGWTQDGHHKDHSIEFLQRIRKIYNAQRWTLVLETALQ